MDLSKFFKRTCLSFHMDLLKLKLIFDLSRLYVFRALKLKLKFDQGYFSLVLFGKEFGAY